jgi:hypothetical protein
MDVESFCALSNLDYAFIQIDYSLCGEINKYESYYIDSLKAIYDNKEERFIQIKNLFSETPERF